MSIIEHAHMWVPWDARRMNVCDKTDCGAATSWDATGVFDWWEWTTERLNDLLAPLELGWRARTEKELALMADLVPLLRKRAAGREISGLSAYEG